MANVGRGVRHLTLTARCQVAVLVTLWPERLPKHRVSAARRPSNNAFEASLQKAATRCRRCLALRGRMHHNQEQKMKATLSSTRVHREYALPPHSARRSYDGVPPPCSENAPRASTCSCSSRRRCKPARVIGFNPVENRTYHYWHVFVPGLKRQIYGFRAHDRPAVGGPRFDSGKVPLDPYDRRVVVPNGYNRAAAHRGTTSHRDEERRRADPGRLEGDRPAMRRRRRSHDAVRGFTRHRIQDCQRRRRYHAG